MHEENAGGSQHPVGERNIILKKKLYHVQKHTCLIYQYVTYPEMSK